MFAAVTARFAGPAAARWLHGASDAFFGSAVASVGWTIAAGGTDLAPYVQGGAISILATAVGYVLKQFADSKIVTFPIAEIIRKASEREKELERKNEDRERRLERTNADREAALQKLLEEQRALLVESKDREDSLRVLLMQRGPKT